MKRRRTGGEERRYDLSDELIFLSAPGASGVGSRTLGGVARGGVSHRERTGQVDADHARPAAGHDCRVGKSASSQPVTTKGRTWRSAFTLGIAASPQRNTTRRSADLRRLVSARQLDG